MTKHPTNRPYARSPRKFLIYPKFQLLLVAINLAIMSGTMLIFWATTQSTIAGLAPMAKLSGIEPEYYRRYLEYQSSQFNQALFFAFIVGTLISTVLTLIISHKVAGPLVRLRGFFRTIAETGRARSKLEFRDGDYLEDIPKLVNVAMTRLGALDESASERPRLRLIKSEDGSGDQAA